MNQSDFLLGDLLRPDRVALQLKGQARNEILRELSALVTEIADRPDAQQTLLRALEEREQLHSTGIGDGVALPHARNALVGLVQRPVLIFGRHSPGVSFGAIDGKPTRLFFLMIAPSVTQHLSMLARISRLLRDPQLRRDLLAADSPEKVVELFRSAEAAMRRDL